MARFNIFNKYSLAILLLTVTIGCGGADEGDGFTGHRGQVSGTVTLDDKPLQEGCQILFMSPSAGFTAAGVVDAEGKYTLEYSDAAGLPVGEYSIQLSAPFVPDSTEVVDPTKMGPKIGADGKVVGTTAGPVPSRYTSTGTSGLTFKVEPNDNVADFPLTSK